jgi:hypothetical protein
MVRGLSGGSSQGGGAAPLTRGRQAICIVFYVCKRPTRHRLPTAAILTGAGLTPAGCALLQARAAAADAYNSRHVPAGPHDHHCGE